MTQPSLSPNSVPTHVAVIMDGNGRWARSRGLERIEGHWQGYRTLKRIVYAADDLGVRYLTVYGFSSENWRRPEGEVSGLMSLMAAAMRAEIEELVQNGIRVRVIGRIPDLPPDLQREFEIAMERTRHYTGMTFSLAINYGGRAEITDAVRRIAEAVRDGQIDVGDINEAEIARRLYAPDIPDPDLLIRTAGELRLSNFLLWQSAYAEMWVTPVFWPDFTPELLMEALEAFGKRTRRFGAVVE